MEEHNGFIAARQRMVEEQLRGRDITDGRVLEALLTIPRSSAHPSWRSPLTKSSKALESATPPSDRGMGRGGCRSSPLTRGWLSPRPLPKFPSHCWINSMLKADWSFPLDG